MIVQLFRLEGLPLCGLTWMPFFGQEGKRANFDVAIAKRIQDWIRNEKNQLNRTMFTETDNRARKDNVLA